MGEYRKERHGPADTTAFGRWLYVNRWQRGISRDQLADECNVTPRAIESWELGERYPRFQQCVRICRMFGVHSIDLVGEWGEDIL